MATSGIILFALSKAADKELKRQFREREPKKYYQALVWGHLEQDSGEINLPMICDWENRPRQRIDFVFGKRAVTFYEVLERLPTNCTRVKLTPITGRSHQLRLHTLALGHPILGRQIFILTHKLKRCHLAYAYMQKNLRLLILLQVKK